VPEHGRRRQRPEQRHPVGGGNEPPPITTCHRRLPERRSVESSRPGFPHAASPRFTADPSAVYSNYKALTGPRGGREVCAGFTHRLVRAVDGAPAGRVARLPGLSQRPHRVREYEGANIVARHNCAARAAGYSRLMGPACSNTERASPSSARKSTSRFNQNVEVVVSDSSDAQRTGI